MTKHINPAKQKKVDDWAKLSAAEKHAPQGFDSEGNPKPTKTQQMMADLEGGLTESILDEAITTNGHSK